MEEARCLADGASVFVVDEGIEEEGMPCERLNVVIGNGGWYEAGVALVKDDFILCGAYLDVVRTLEAHGDDEGVVLNQIAMKTLVDVHNADVEEVGIDDARCGFFLDHIVGTVFVIDLIAECLSSEYGVELTRFTIKSRAVVVEDAVDDI